MHFVVILFLLACIVSRPDRTGDYSSNTAVISILVMDQDFGQSFKVNTKLDGVGFFYIFQKLGFVHQCGNFWIGQIFTNMR